MYLTPRKCRELGLFLLACGFHGPVEDTTLLITHPDSAIRRIIVRASDLRLDGPPVGLSMVPFALRYYPSETTTHPWMYDCDTSHLPVFALSNAGSCVVSPTEGAMGEAETPFGWELSGAGTGIGSD